MLYDNKWDKEPVRHLTEAENILMGAAKYIEEHGWLFKGYGSAVAGPVCMSKAIDIVAYKGPNPEKVGAARAKLVKFLKTDLTRPDKFHTAEIVKWNDTDGRTEKQVIDMLRRAALTEVIK